MLSDHEMTFTKVRYAILIITEAFAVCASAIVNGFTNSAATVRMATKQDAAALSPGFRFVVEDFVRAGGRGRIFLVEPTAELWRLFPEASQIYEGPYLIVDELPKGVSPQGNSLFSRDVGVLQYLEFAIQNGIRIILQSIEREDDGRVFIDDDVRAAIYGTGLLGERNGPALGISAAISRDTFVHEWEHVLQNYPNHSLRVFVTSLRSNFSNEELGVIRRGLAEVFSYRAQMTYLLKEAERRPSEVLILVKADDRSSHHVEAKSFESLMKHRRYEIRVRVGGYLATLKPVFQNHRGDTASVCRVVVFINQLVSGIPELEQGFGDSALATGYRCN